MSMLSCPMEIARFTMWKKQTELQVIGKQLWLRANCQFADTKQLPYREQRLFKLGNCDSRREHWLETLSMHIRSLAGRNIAGQQKGTRFSRIENRGYFKQTSCGYGIHHSRILRLFRTGPLTRSIPSMLEAY